MPHITIVTEPVAKGRPRYGGGHFYTPRETRDYEDLIAWMTKRLPRHEGPLCLNVVFYCTPRRHMPDLDNLIKSLLDGMQKGGSIKNDEQVVQINACRLEEARRPRVEFSVVAIDNVELPELL